MMIVASQSDRIASAARRLSYRCVRRVFLSFLTVVALASFNLEDVAWAAEQPKTDGAVEDRVQALIPELEAYIAGGMKEFDVPGLAIGIVAKDRLVYAKGFVPRVLGVSVHLIAAANFNSSAHSALGLLLGAVKCKAHIGSTAHAEPFGDPSLRHCRSLP